jgi:hypothetical protein
MTKLETMPGLCAALAMAICAFGAQGASANTAVTCEPVTTGAQFRDAHCKEEPAFEGGGFAHRVIAEGGPTAITLTNETTTLFHSIGKLKSVQSGVTLELQSTEIIGTGAMENRREFLGETMWAEGFGTIEFTNVTVTAPFAKGCEVVGGKVATKKLRGTTKGLTKELKFEPFEGTTFATFEIKGCVAPLTVLNHVYTATGSVKGATNGTTTEFVHGTTTPTKTGTTGQETLKLFGQNAGLEGSVTIKMLAGSGIALT